MSEISFDALPKELERIASRVTGAGEIALRRAARRGLGEVHDAIQATTPFVPTDSGQYRRAWSVADVAGGADLFNSTVQAAVIEEGARPHLPPLAPLLAWARRKKRGEKVTYVKYSRKKERFVRRTGASLAAHKEEAALEWAESVRWHMKAHGQKPKRVLGRAAEKFPRFVSEELDREIRRALRR